LSANAGHLEELTWKDVAAGIKQFDLELYEAIEASDLPQDWSIFKATYPYGAHILKDGLFYIPNAQGELVLLSDESIPKHIQKKLGYNHNSNPVAFVWKNALEIFLPHNESIFTYVGPIAEGRLFGASLVLSETNARRFHPTFLWQMTAGARSLILLPKIGDAAGLDRLDKYFKINSRHLTSEGSENWFLFKELAQRLDQSDSWSMEVLFFSKEWFEWSDRAETPFKSLLYKRNWKGTEFWRNEFLWNMVFSIFKEEKLAKINPFIADTAKYLMHIAVGAQPGYAPITQDNVVGPIGAFQKILREIYQIEYSPIFMLPKMFNLNEIQPVYYSLAYPNSLEFSPNNRKASTKINDLIEIDYFLKKYIGFLKTNTLKIQDTEFFAAAQKVKFSLYHQKQEEETQSVETLFQLDNAFKNAVFLKQAKGWTLPKNAHFLKGCIKISVEE